MNKFIIPVVAMALLTSGKLNAQDRSKLNPKGNTGNTLTIKKAPPALDKKMPTPEPVKTVKAPEPKKMPVAEPKKIQAAAPPKAVPVVVPRKTHPVAKKETKHAKKAIVHQAKKRPVHVAHRKAARSRGERPIVSEEMKKFDLTLNNAGPVVVEVRNGNLSVNGDVVAPIVDARRENIKVTINTKSAKDEDDDAVETESGKHEEARKCCEKKAEDCCHHHMPARCETGRRENIKYEYRHYRYLHPYMGTDARPW